MQKIKKGTIVFSRTAGRASEVLKTIKSNNKITEAFIAMSAYTAEYTNGDHHLKKLQIELEVKIGSSSTIQNLKDRILITGKLWLADKNADDPFKGKISYVLFYKIGGAVIPPVG